MRRAATLLTYAIVLLLAYRSTHSASGFLVTGLGVIALLDRYAGRLFSPAPGSVRREVVLHVGSFGVGAATFFLMRPGIVPLWEAAYRGLVVCWMVLLIETAGRRLRWVPAVLVCLIALLVPSLAALHPLHTVPKRTPAALGLAFEDIRLRSADGVELAAWLVPYPDARGTLVFCHGHGRNRGHVAGLLTMLQDMKLNVLAFDFRGHGASDGHTSTFGREEVDDLEAAVAYVEQRFPGRPVLLAGVSLGAAVSLQALPRLPQVRGLWSEGAFARLRHAVNREFAALPDCLRNPLVRTNYLFGWLDCGLWAPAVNPIDRLEGVRVPVFFCHAREDELVPFSDGQALYDTYAGPKERWWVDGATHYNVRQQNAEEYKRRMKEFLERCLGEVSRDQSQKPLPPGRPLRARQQIPET